MSADQQDYEAPSVEQVDTEESPTATAAGPISDLN